MRTWCFQRRLGSHFTTPVKMLDSELLSLVVYAMRNWEGMENKIPFQKVYLVRTFFNLHLSIQIGPRNAMWSAGRFFVVSHSTTSRMVLNFQFCSLVGKLIACEIFFLLSFFSQILLRWKMKNNCKVHFSSGPMDIAINFVFIVFHFIWNWLLYFFGALFPDFNNIDWHFSADALTYLSSISFFHFDNEAINKMVDHYRF